MATPSTEPCNLHEITNCSICTGLDKEQLAEDTGTLWSDFGQYRPLGTVFAAQRAGRCASCGHRFEAGADIRWSSDVSGWVEKECG